MFLAANFPSILAGNQRVNSNWACQWEMANFDPYKNDTHELIAKKLLQVITLATPTYLRT